MSKKIKNKIKGSLLYKNKKLKKKIKDLKKENIKLEFEINKIKKQYRDLQDVNYEISSNNYYLMEQRKKTNKKLKQVKIELEDFRLKERLNNGRKEEK